METDKEPLFASEEYVEEENNHDNVVVNPKTPQNGEERIHVCSNNYQHRSTTKQNNILAIFVLASILVLVLYLVFGNRVSGELLLVIVTFNKYDLLILINSTSDI